ncbi:N-acetylmuramoyl-L-alanine amidase [Saprospiraceae bacterium]|nr:N-acetylmuramoyl-L-alanine amidase [Saprospiraceae bacterium]
MHKLVLLTFFLLSYSSLPKLHAQGTSTSTATIVIDPGHGGKDNGTTGSQSKEKNITLAISKKLRSYLAAKAPSMQVHLTRENDTFIKLNERSGLANKLSADLFISIHCNHLHLSSVHGSEIYIMGLEKGSENIEIVKRENQHYMQEHSHHAHDHNSDENHIMMHMFQYNYLAESAEFANQLKEQMNKNTIIKQRGIKQAGFVVLKRAGMPGVLFESAYLSNPRDEAYLLSQHGQDQIASSLGEAIISYFATKTQSSVAQDNYKLLLAETSDKSKLEIDSKWQHVSTFEIDEQDGLYSYYTGTYNSFSEAKSQQEFLISRGFQDAKIILIPKE